MNQEERKLLVWEMIDIMHELKKKCKHQEGKPCKCNEKCNDVVNCRKCQVVQLLRKDVILE